MRSADCQDYEMTVLLKFLIVIHNFVNVSTINWSKSLAGFRLVTSLDGISGSLIQTSFSGVCDSRRRLACRLFKSWKTLVDKRTSFCSEIETIHFPLAAQNTYAVYVWIVSVDAPFEAQLESSRKRKLTENHAGNIPATFFKKLSSFKCLSITCVVVFVYFTAFSF